MKLIPPPHVPIQILSKESWNMHRALALRDFGYHLLLVYIRGRSGPVKETYFALDPVW